MIYGLGHFLGGKWIKDTLITRDWCVAAATVHEWEAAREIGPTGTTVPYVREALQKYFDDAEARNLLKSTIRRGGSFSREGCFLIVRQRASIV